MTALNSLLIACKYEGEKNLSMYDLVAAGDYNFTLDDLISSEISVLQIINYKV